jgi:hypothetical protein
MMGAAQPAAAISDDEVRSSAPRLPLAFVVHDMIILPKLL